MHSFRHFIESELPSFDGVDFIKKRIQRANLLLVDGKYPIFPNPRLWDDVIEYMYKVGNNLKGDILAGMNSGQEVKRSIIYSIAHCNAFLRFDEESHQKYPMIDIMIVNLNIMKNVWEYLLEEELVFGKMPSVSSHMVCSWNINGKLHNILYEKQMGLEQYLGAWHRDSNILAVDNLNMCPSLIKFGDSGKQINVLAYSKYRKQIGDLLKYHLNTRIEFARGGSGRPVINYDLESFDLIKSLHNEYAGEEV